MATINSTGKSNEKSKTLENFSTNLSKLAIEGKLEKLIGREEEIDRLSQILSRKKKSNPVVVGEPGCGKTALIEGLAINIAEGNCSTNLIGKEIYNLDVNSIIAGTKFRGQFEERMKIIMQEVKEHSNIILFIDEVHTIVGAGNSSEGLDVSNIIKPFLSRGEIQIIGATTPKEYKSSLEKDGALNRRFQKVNLNGTNREETLNILNKIKTNYEEFHKVKYSDKLLTLCVDLSNKYIKNKVQPDKSIDILDEIGAKTNLNYQVPEELTELKNKAKEIKKQKDLVVKKQEFERAAEIREKEKEIIEEISRVEHDISVNRKYVEINENLLYDTISSMTKIPKDVLDKDDNSNIINIEKTLKNKVIGQDDAIDKISKSIKRNYTGVRKNAKTVGNFMFVGSTGVGKTYLAKQIARHVYGSEDSLIRMDMSEFQEKHTASRLVGAPPGYVGYGEGGELTEKVRNNPHSVILLDEIEKANKDIYSLLLQIMDDGHITDGNGVKIDFSNTLIIMTSNVGVKKMNSIKGSLGFSTKETSLEKLKNSTLDKEIKEHFAPEFLNRIDNIVKFNRLNKKMLKNITKLEISEFIEHMHKNNYNINITTKVIDKIVSNVNDLDNGARPIKREIQDLVENFTSDMILLGKIKHGKEYTIGIEKGELSLK